MKTFKEVLDEKNELNVELNVELNEVSSKKFQPGGAVRASQLKVGNYYFAFYNNTGGNIELFKFTGFSDAEQKYGESGPVFNSLKDAKKQYGLKTMKDIENMSSENNREYGQHLYMCGEWEDGNKGCFYYVYNKSWSRGSGADRLSFSEAVPVLTDK